MYLKRFSVTDFRSVANSGWIDVQRVTAFIGINESGKTNLLTPLWKLNPAREGEIQPTSDYPKKKFGDIRQAPSQFCFISAEFDCTDVADELARLSGYDAKHLRNVLVRRFYDGHYEVEFPDCAPERSIPAEVLRKILQTALTDITALSALSKEEALKADMLDCLSRLISDSDHDADSDKCRQISSIFSSKIPSEPMKTSTIVPRTNQMIEAITSLATQLSRKAPGEVAEVKRLVTSSMPRFVYYSNYGNLDSEIYLPHVVENLRRKDLGAKEAAKARTLRVLFRFVTLSPEEILELGRDFQDPNNPTRKPTEDEIAQIADNKRQRSILLQAAGTKLTARFKEWWKQGDYRFRFEADGDHFRIWVSDDKRPEEVELESRSTGLQWFLSFYLIFLVESQTEHHNTILLLDEPGLSLHPLAQRNLSEFFEGLSQTNQIIYTTHSPFLVDADRLDRARKVYISSDGTTKATEDLREGTMEQQPGASYAVHSALNLNVAESLLLGCEPIIVEGPSDQHWLSGIKAVLVGSGNFSPKRELVFPPSGGTKTARIIAAILTGRDEIAPRVLLDSDEAGDRTARELKTGLYQDHPERVLSIATFTGIERSEIEDLIPATILAKIVDRWQREPEEPFSDVAEDGKPVIPQIEKWAKRNGVVLSTGWKVDLSKRVKTYLLDRSIQDFDESTVSRWKTLFETLASRP